jgi:hypothetical protein
VGTLLLGRGAKPLAGRVAATAAMGTRTLVTLQLVPLADLFHDLRLDEVFDLSRAEVLLPDDVQAQFDIVREGNTCTFTPRPRSSRSGRERRSSVTGTHARDILPFRSCDVTLLDVDGTTSLPLSLEAPSFAVTLSPTLEARYSRATGLERFIVRAAPDVAIGTMLKGTGRVSGDVRCTLQLFAFRLPIGGPLAFFIGGLVPVGVGFEYEAATEFASFSAGVQATARGDASVGLDCIAGACGFVRALDNAGATLTPSFELPSAATDLRLTSKLKVFGYFEAELGNPLLRSLRFKAFDARVGGALAGSFAPPVVQMADTGYAADYQASLQGRAQVGLGIDNLARLLSLGSVTKLGLDFEHGLARSPQVIAVPADRASFLPGDLVGLSVLLDPATLHFLPGLYNVESVQLRRRVGGITEVLATQTATPGQERFDFSVVAPHAGDVSQWYAFVATKLLPAELLSLELGAAAAARLDVLLLFGRTDAERRCSASAAEEYDGDLPGLDDRSENEAEPARCSARAASAQATGDASASVSGLQHAEFDPPRAVSVLSSSGVSTASASAAAPGGSTDIAQFARASGRSDTAGVWDLLVQGQAVTMTITGSVSNAGFGATWSPSLAGAGVHGRYELPGTLEDQPNSGSNGPLSHAVRLEPGQRVQIKAEADARAGARAEFEWSAGNPNKPNDSQSVRSSFGFTVTFAP